MLRLNDMNYNRNRTKENRHLEYLKSKNKKCLDCGVVISSKSTYCVFHANLKERSPFYISNKGKYEKVNLGNGIFNWRHRLEMEKKLGRELSKNEVVHHVNEDKMDNEHENLILFRSNSSHGRFHAFMKRHGLIGITFDQPWILPSL